MFIRTDDVKNFVLSGVFGAMTTGRFCDQDKSPRGVQTLVVVAPNDPAENKRLQRKFNW